MQRRQFHHAATGAIGALLWGALAQAHALSLSQLTNAEAGNGVKAALTQGAEAAVALLGKPDGFLSNPQVRIPLPGQLAEAAKLLQRFGMGQRIEQLETTLNRAAEAAVPAGKAVLLQAVQNMTVADAKGILAGGDTSVTQFFASKTRSPLGERFLPIVTRETDKLGLVQQYNQLAGKAAGFGLLKAEDANLAQYVTGKTLDGLFTTIAEQERALRRDPVGAGSALLQKVFGALK